VKDIDLKNKSAAWKR